MTEFVDLPSDILSEVALNLDPHSAAALASTHHLTKLANSYYANRYIRDYGSYPAEYLSKSTKELYNLKTFGLPVHGWGVTHPQIRATKVVAHSVGFAVLDSWGRLWLKNNECPKVEPQLVLDTNVPVMLAGFSGITDVAIGSNSLIFIHQGQAYIMGEDVVQADDFSPLITMLSPSGIVNKLTLGHEFVANYKPEPIPSISSSIRITEPIRLVTADHECFLLATDTKLYRYGHSFPSEFDELPIDSPVTAISHVGSRAVFTNRNQELWMLIIHTGTLTKFR